MAPPGPVTSAVMAVFTLLGGGLIYERSTPSGQERIDSAIQSLKVKLHMQNVQEAEPASHQPPPAAGVKQPEANAGEAKAAAAKAAASKAAEAKKAAEKKAADAKAAEAKAAEAKAAQAKAAAAAAAAASGQEWSSATPNDSEQDDSAASKTPPPQAEKAKPETAAPSPQAARQAWAASGAADAKEKLKEFVGPVVAKLKPLLQHLEVNAIAFDNWVSGPVLREKLMVQLKTLGITPYLPILEKWLGEANSLAESVGLSSVAASAIMSLALLADLGLFWLFVLWRLCKCFRKPSEDPRQKKIDTIKELQEKNGGATPRKGSGGSTPSRKSSGGKEDAKAAPKSPAHIPATPPTSGKKKNSRK